MERRTQARPKAGNQPSEEQPPRKGPHRVVKLEALQITQDEIQQASVLQAIAWRAERRAHQYITALERRLERGASIEDGPLDFDKDLEMVRTRKMERPA